MEKRYLHLRKKTEIFNDYKEKGQENTRLQPETMLMFGLIGIPNIRTPKSEYHEALEDYKLWAKHIGDFGLSVGWCSINIKSYEEVLK